MVEAIKNKINNIEYREKKIFWTLFSIFLFLLVSYGIEINNTIMNAVSKQNMEKEMISLNTDINSMEFDYINAKNKITLDYAHSLGYVSISNDKFASISTNYNSLSLHINEN
jgi:hypothetical protein